MPNAIKRWFQKRRAAKTTDQGSFPRLPCTRPCRLTPSPSYESLVSSTVVATAQSTFFTKLPREIRRAILIEAFGNRIVHMDLIYDHPPLPKNEGPVTTHPGRDISHCNMNVNFYPGDRPDTLKLDESMPKQWIWRSSVCHRNPPRLPSCDREVQPGQDLCRFGQTPYNAICGTWPGEYPRKCFIGIMGWLLSCRQAYIEGIDVLYSTNTIHTASKEMLMCLDQILPPQRVSSIKSVELLWDFEPFPKFNDRPPKTSMSDMQSFRSFLDKVPSMFPNVRDLHISLNGQLLPTKVVNGETSYDHRISRVDDCIINPVDSMALKLGPNVQAFSIGIPSSVYKAQRNRAREAGETVEQVHCGKLERHWRPLNNSSSRSGYWVQLGQKDLTPPFMCTMGEGGYNYLVSREDWVLYA